MSWVIPGVTPTDVLREAALELAEVLSAARRTVADPDYWGGEWYEVYSGNPLLEIHVMVDYVGNVVHVRRQSTSFDWERFTVTYLPSWFYATIRRHEPGEDWKSTRSAHFEEILAQVVDRDLAVPLRIEVRVVHQVKPPRRDPLLPSVLRPPVVYDLRPARAVLALRGSATPAPAGAPSGGGAVIPPGAEGLDRMLGGRVSDVAGPAPVRDVPADDGPAVLRAQDVERVHWTAPSIRITAAPGVAVSTSELYPAVEVPPADVSGGASALRKTPFWGWFVMNAATSFDDVAGFLRAQEISSTQALALEIERRQNPESLPVLGAPRRASGSSETDLLMPGASLLSRTHFDETTRPDGVDLNFLTPQALSRLRAAAASPIRGLLLDLLTAIQTPVRLAEGGGLPPDVPIPVLIRVDPESAEDRFAYSVTYLKHGHPTPFGLLAGPLGPYFRLTVIRTEGVQVNVGLFFGPEGTRQLAKLIEFREKVVSFDRIPVAIPNHGDCPEADDICVRTAELRRRDLTVGEIVDVITLVIGLIPFPPFQVAADLYDYATIISYLVAGTDPVGRKMNRLEFAITLAGVLLPEVLEQALKSMPRLVTVGDNAAGRIEASLRAVSTEELEATTVPLRDIGGSE